MNYEGYISNYGQRRVGTRYQPQVSVQKPGENKWGLIDLRELNRYCTGCSLFYETLKHLRHLARKGDYFISLDMADGYYALGKREEDRDFSTVNYWGELWRLTCLPMRSSGSA
jgi:hypothetical protein